MSKMLFYITLLSTIALWGSCNKDKPTPIVQGSCAGATPFKAVFGIYERTADSLYATDTISNFETWFQSTGNYDSIRVNVGDDPRDFNSKLFRLDFKFANIGQRINVRMIGMRKTASACFPNEKLVDTVNTSFVIVCPKTSPCDAAGYTSVENPIVGRFRGYNTDEPNKVFTIIIADQGNPPSGSTSDQNGIRIYNLPLGCGGPFIPSGGGSGCGGDSVNRRFVSIEIDEVGYKSFFTSSNDGGSIGDCCKDIKMWGHIDENDRNTMIIYHTNYNAAATKLRRKFIGKRI
jgi:hypothetical protein